MHRGFRVSARSGSSVWAAKVQGSEVAVQGLKHFVQDGAPHREHQPEEGVCRQELRQTTLPEQRRQRMLKWLKRARERVKSIDLVIRGGGSRVQVHPISGSGFETVGC